MSVPAVLVAYALHSHTAFAACASVLFILGYVTLYARLVRFRWCSPIAFLLVKPVHVLRAQR
jgi:hypothetical protein